MMRLSVVQWGLVAELRAAQADLARQAAAEERRRIASEIHDIAAHSLAVTLLHLTGARLRIQRQGGDTDLIETLAAAERLGRQRLDDVRRTVGLLQTSSTATAPPLPTAADLQQLIDEFRSAGLDLTFDVSGDPGSVSPAAGLALYRISQEALANAVKHAPGMPMEVQLDCRAPLRLRICNKLPQRPALSTPTGLGLGSMRERAELLGGTLTVGPSDGTWRVECSIPN
jgi:signal transduction histidine kinase